jgi:DNA-binding SARP family transcriptional activator/TolB-like protein
MPLLRLDTLGSTQLTGPTGLLLPNARRRELAMLTYLARQATHTATRAELAALFWGEKHEPRARQSLRQLLFRLRQVLEGTLDVGSDAVALEMRDIDLDVMRFETAVAERRLADAVGHYGGEFLKGCDDLGTESFRDWLQAERTLLERQLAWTQEQLLEQAEGRSDWQEAAYRAQQWSNAFPYDEAPMIRLVTALGRHGRVAEALAQHDAFLVRMREHVGVELSAKFLGLRSTLTEANRPSSSGRPASAALLTPDLVGRAAALAVLDDLWRGRAQRSATVLIEGDAGIGKTRLIREFVRQRRTAGEPLLLLEVRSEGDTAEPFAAAHRLFTPLRHAAGLSGASDRALSDLSFLVPALRERFPNLPEPKHPESRLAHALTEVLQSVGEEARVLVVVDDFPRLDSASRALLLALAQRQPPALLLLLARSDELRALGTLALLDDGTVARIKLQPLEPAEVAALVGSMVELENPRERALLIRRIHEVSGGVPFYAVELVSALADKGILALGAAGRWQLRADVEDAPLPMPENVDDAIRLRLAVLGPDTRTVLETAAAIGQRVPATLLEMTCALPIELLSSAVNELVAKRLLRWLPGVSPSYEITNELIRRVAYDAMPASRRCALHAAIADALRRAGGKAPARAQELQYHRQRAGDPPKNPGLRRRVSVAAMGIVLIVASTTLFLQSSKPASAAGPEIRVVVVPFEDRTGDPQLRPIGRIAADWITQGIARAALATVAPPPVFPPTAPVEHARSGLDADLELAREAEADIVIRGSYHRSGDSVKVLAEIVDVRNRQVMAVVSPVAAAARDPMPAIEDIQEHTLAALAPLVDQRISSSALVQSAPPKYASYLAFAEGLDHFYARRGDVALPHFERAYALDTTYTLPLLYAALVHDGHHNFAAAESLLYVLRPRRVELAPYDRYILDFMLARVRQDWRRMYVAAQAAARIAPGSLLAVYHLPQVAIALNQPQRAVDILSSVDPDRGAARGLTGYWNLLAHALHMVGAYDRQLALAFEVRRRYPEEHRALSYQARALAALGGIPELDDVLNETLLLPSIPGWGPPGLPAHITAAEELNAHGQPEHARRVLERALAFYQNTPPALINLDQHQIQLGRAYYQAGRLAEARAVFEQLLAKRTNELSPADILGYIGFVAVLQQDVARVREVETALARDRAPFLFGRNTDYLARIAALQGKRAEAVRLLRKALAEGRPYESSMHVTHEFAALRGYPPFEDLIRPKTERPLGR